MPMYYIIYVQVAPIKWIQSFYGDSLKSSNMGRKVPEWAESQLSSFLGQPVMELVPTWARVPFWSRTRNTKILSPLNVDNENLESRTVVLRLKTGKFQFWKYQSIFLNIILVSK